MIDTVLNLLFRCPHRRLTRPVTPVSKSGESHGQTYVACLDCGKHFAYDAREMRIGKAIRSSDQPLHPEVVRQHTRKKIGFALLASLPFVVLIGSVLKPRKRQPPTDESASRY